MLGLSKELKNAPKDDEHPPIDLLVDAIVGLLDEPSAFGKAVAIQAFGMLSGEVESSTIDLILTVSRSPVLRIATNSYLDIAT